MINRKISMLGFVLVLLWSWTLLSCGKSKTNNPSPTPPSPVTPPELSMQNASVVRGTKDTVMTFYVYLNKSITKDVSVDYNIVNRTAISPENFEATSGTVIIPTSETSAKIDVTIKGNSMDLRQPNLQFTVQLSNAKSCTLSNDSAVGTIITENGTYLPTDTTGYETPTSYPGYTLVWSDEFSGKTLNSNYWVPETGNGSSGWGNNELEYYTNSLKNIFVSDGNLIIEARKESQSGFDYTSARITTQNKESFQYGRIDIRAKLPVAKGIWPALWMLGSNINSVSWPACGETDIMELIGTYPNTIYGTMHWASTNGSVASKGTNYVLPAGDFSQQFHVFSIVWAKDAISWYVDNKLYLTATKADVGADNYPFNAAQFFIFNVAVGGNWPGSPDPSTAFPQRMFVDYVRVFQQTKK